MEVLIVVMKNSVYTSPWVYTAERTRRFDTGREEF